MELNTIDWTSLRHAHGVATDVPAMLQALLSDDADVRDQACAELHETVWHQGTVYSASAVVVPLLGELLARPDLQDRGCVVSLLCCIATGEGWVRYGLRVDGEETLRRRYERQGRSLEAEQAQERAAMAAIHRGVAEVLPLLLPFLADRDGLGPLVAETLAHFPEDDRALSDAELPREGKG